LTQPRRKPADSHDRVGVALLLPLGRTSEIVLPGGRPTVCALSNGRSDHRRLSDRRSNFDPEHRALPSIGFGLHRARDG
jgi:hypothetical protein